MIALAKNMKEDDNKGLYNQAGGAVEKNVIDEYEYVMYGKIFECKSENKDKIVNVSFGGLLMSLRGTISNLKQLQQDSRIYLLMKRAT